MFSRVNVLKLIQLNVSFKHAKKFAQAAALRPTKAKSQRKEANYYSDTKVVRTKGGKGGDGCVSFLQVWCNDKAGPDGGDGGNGGHVIFQATNEVRNFNHMTTSITAEEGEPGGHRNCHGKTANHTIVKVPIGTIVRDQNGRIVGDLDREGVMFVAARGGAGGKGSRFFATAKERAPKVCEYGPKGEEVIYKLELRSMADIGFIGLPNAGKSTLLNAISRAKPKIAPYAFTTLRPHIGIVQYEDHVQLAVADLPGLIAGSHQNKGLGIQFLKHAERCAALMFVLDASAEKPWQHYEQLTFELEQFSSNLIERPQIVVANKMDAPEAKENLIELQKRIKTEVIPISAKMGTNLTKLLLKMREYYDKYRLQCETDAKSTTK